MEEVRLELNPVFKRGLKIRIVSLCLFIFICTFFGYFIAKQLVMPTVYQTEEKRWVRLSSPYMEFTSVRIQPYQPAVQSSRPMVVYSEQYRNTVEGRFTSGRGLGYQASPWKIT